MPFAEAPAAVPVAEAAALADLEPRDVHRAFDEALLPAPLLLGEGPARRVARGAVPLLAFYFGTAGVLEAAGRRAVIARAAAAAGEGGAVGPFPLGEGVVVDLGPFVRRAEERAALVARARAAVAADPGVLGGAVPVLRGTRVPARDVAAAVRAGTPVADILADFPGLTAEMVELAAVYARAEPPPRGRPPRARPEAPDGSPSGGGGARAVRSGAVPRARVAAAAANG